MIALYEDPDGKKVFSRTQPAATVLEVVPDARTLALEQKVKELESELVIYKV